MNLLQLANEVQARQGMPIDSVMTPSVAKSTEQIRNTPAGDEKKFILPPLNVGHEKFNPSSDELADLLGQNWPRVAADPPLLAQWVHTIRTNRKVESGLIPPEFVYPAHCTNCGDVLLDYETREELQACPWCFCPNEKRPNFAGLQ